jgi:DNA-binding MarR family transcriptional regulator
MAKPLSKPDLIDDVMQHLRRIVKALQVYSSSVETQFGVTGPQLWALWTIQQGGPLGLKDLAVAMHLHPSTVVGVVDRLEQRGLLRREPDPKDARRVRIRLTTTGRKLVKQAPHPAQGQLIHGLQAMSPAEVTRLQRALKRLVNVMEADGMEARFFFSDE